MTQTVMFEGQPHQFPDDATDTEIAQALQSLPIADTSNAGIQARIAATTPTTFGQNVLHGLGNSVLGGMETAAHFGAPLAAAAGGTPESVAAMTNAGAPISDLISSRDAAWQVQRRAAGDTGLQGGTMLGEALGAAPLMAALPESSGLMGGMLQGATATLMQPVGNTPQGYAASKAEQLGINTGLGGVLGWLLGGKGGNNAPSENDYRDAVNYLRERDVTPTIGQNIGPNAATWEDKLSTLNLNVPGAQKDALKSFNVAALNEALDPLGMSYTGPPGNTAFKNVRQVVDKAYDSIKSKISLPVTDEFRTQIGQIVSDAATPDASIAKTTQKILDKALYSKIGTNGVLDGSSFKAAEEELGTYAKDYMGNGASATERQVGRALISIQGALRDSLEDANPQVAAQLRATNRAYAILARVQDAVPVGNPDRLFTPYQLASSVARADNTVRGRAYTEGDALLQKFSDAGLRVLGNKFPDSGTAGRVMNADPFALAMQGAITVPTYPLYSRMGTRLAGAAINGVANASNVAGPLMGSAARALQPVSPYLLPGFLSGARSLMGSGP